LFKIVVCPACNATLRVPEDLLGERVQCPRCKQEFRPAPGKPGDDAPGERISTVNVIEYVGGGVAQVISFPDNQAGNKAAEVLFRAMAKESGFFEREIAVGLEEGRLENKPGTCQLFLVHSQL
jgi:predicted Zn finger-like uncharacterized protein